MAQQFDLSTMSPAQLAELAGQVQEAQNADAVKELAAFFVPFTPAETDDDGKETKSAKRENGKVFHVVGAGIESDMAEIKRLCVTLSENGNTGLFDTLVTVDSETYDDCTKNNKEIPSTAYGPTDVGRAILDQLSSISESVKGVTDVLMAECRVLYPAKKKKEGGGGGRKRTWSIEYVAEGANPKRFVQFTQSANPDKGLGEALDFRIDTSADLSGFGDANTTDNGRIAIAIWEQIRKDVPVYASSISRSDSLRNQWKAELDKLDVKSVNAAGA